MRRREFLSVLGSAAVWPLAARAQEPGRTYRLGDLHLSPRNALYNVALFDAVKPDGFLDGKNLIVDDRGFGLRVDQLADHASAVVKAEVDLIVCSGDPCVRAAQQATKTLPILGLAEDMVRSGFVASLAKPGGNTTGVSILTSELNGKRQDILLEAVPGVRRMAALADVNSSLPQQLQAMQDAASARGVAGTDSMAYTHRRRCRHAQRNHVGKRGVVERDLMRSKSDGREPAGGQSS